MLERTVASEAETLVERLRQFPLDSRIGAIGTWVEVWVQLGGPVPLALATWIEDLHKHGLADEAEALARLGEAPRRVRGTIRPDG